MNIEHNILLSTLINGKQQNPICIFELSGVKVHLQYTVSKYFEGMKANILKKFQISPYRRVAVRAPRLWLQHYGRNAKILFKT